MNQAGAGFRRTKRTATSEYARLLEFTQRHNALLLENKYLARSDYRRLIDDYANVDTFFTNLKIAKTTALNVYIINCLRNFSDPAGQPSQRFNWYWMPILSVATVLLGTC